MELSEKLAGEIAAGSRKALEEFAALIVQETLRALPRATKQLTKEAFLLQTKAREFYEANPSLAGERRLVQKLLEQEEARSPGLEIEKLLARVRPKALALVSEQERLRGIRAEKPPVEQLDRRLR